MNNELKEKRIFHGLVNYGTQAGFFSKQLKVLGYKAFSVSIPDNSKRLVDYELNKSGNLVIKNINRFKNYIKYLNWFFKFDIFHFYFGKTFFPYNIDLYFYKLFNKKVVMEYLGHDVDLCLGMNGFDYRNRKCNRIKKIKRINRQAKWVDRQLVCAPYYYQFVNNSIILPLAIDIQFFNFTKIAPNYSSLKILHSPTNRTYKKSDYIENALSKLKKEGYNFEYKCITNVTHEELIKEYKDADIVIDQLNPWYGTVSIEAMALGRPVISGFHPHLIDYDRESYSSLPIINASIYTIYNVLKDVLDQKYDLEDIGKKSREFVENTHDLKKVTEKLINIYNEL